MRRSRAERRPEMRAHDELVGRLDQQRRGQPPAVLSSSRAERVGLLDRAREPVEQEAVGASSSARRSRIIAMITSSGTSSPSLHVASARRPSSVPAVARGAQHVAGRDVRQPEVRRQQRGLGALAGAGRAEQDEVEFRHGQGSRRPGRERGASGAQPSALLLRKPS